MKKPSMLLRLAAGMLALACAAGALHAVRAGVASWLYYRSRYGTPPGNDRRVEDACRRAHALYPVDYYVCIWAGKTALYGAMDASGAIPVSRLAEADRWSAAGMRLNPLNGEVVRLRTDVLLFSDLDAAVALWERHVAFAFWNRYHLAFLAELYALAGRLDEAEETLYWLQGSPWFGGAQRRLNEALWRRRIREGE